MRHLVVLCTLSLLFGCQQPKTTLPADAVDAAKLPLLLADIHLAKAEADLAREVDSAITVTADSAIFSKYGIREEQFSSTMAWYHEHPSELAVVYEEVINELSRRQGNSSLPSTR